MEVYTITFCQWEMMGSALMRTVWACSSPVFNYLWRCSKTQSYWGGGGGGVRRKHLMEFSLWGWAVKPQLEVNFFKVSTLKKSWICFLRRLYNVITGPVMSQSQLSEKNIQLYKSTTFKKRGQRFYGECMLCGCVCSSARSVGKISQEPHLIKLQ